MAKDGSMRGGARPGAGRKPKALKEKLDAGNPGKRKLTKLDIAEGIDGTDVPPPSEFLSAEQRDGKPLGADIIYNKTFAWLAKLNCEKLVNPQLVEQYAVSVARWVQCEEFVTRYGVVKPVGKEGRLVQSPFLTASHAYMKQANLLWSEIFQVVKENCTTDAVRDNGAGMDMMELLLRKREGR